MSANTLLDLHNQVDAHINGGVKNRAQLDASLVTLADAVSAYRSQLSKLRKMNQSLAELARLDGEYMQDHPNCLENGLVERADGSLTGEYKLDDNGNRRTFFLTVGTGPLKRCDGNQLSQEFLKGLKEANDALVKTRLELVQGEVSRQGLTEKQLDKLGLYRDPKYTIEEEIAVS